MLYRFGEHELDTARFALSRCGLGVAVEPQALRLLKYLIENRDRVVRRQELHDTLSGSRVVSDNALSTCVRSARRAVGDDGQRQAVIRTVQGAGYQFVAPLAIAPHCDAQAGANAIEYAEEGDVASSGNLDDRGAAAAQPSIVVLPFETLGGGESTQVIARGLVHDIITRIARSRSMFIIARGTAFRFEGSDHDVREIGARLSVRYVVQGALRVHDKRLKVDVSLADARTRGELWSEEYDRKLDDFMAVQEEIAEKVVGTLESQVQHEEMRRSLLMPSSNLDAWSAYHRGLHYLLSFSERGCENAERYLRRSIDLEPTIPRPYAAMSFVNFERVFLNFEHDRASGIRKAFDYARMSLDIDPLDPMGHWALSRAYLLQGALDSARESLETAVTLNPSFAVAQYSIGWVALQLGENELCLDKIDFARRLSPFDPLKFAMLGVYALNLAMMGRTEEAAALSARSSLQPNVHHQAFAFAAVTHALDGQHEQARSYYSRVKAIDPEYNIEQFLTTFVFQRDQDIRRVRDAFRVLGSSSRLN
jgi:TolB-like protein